MATTARTLSEAAAPAKKNTLLPILIIIVGILIAAGAAAYSYFESQRTETLVILARDIPYGQQITAADLTTVEMPRYRPNQLQGIHDPAALVGQFAARNLGTNDYAQPSMFMPAPPAEPVYPNGVKLQPNMVPVPFAVGAVGPITDRDRLNLLYLTDDVKLCKGERSASASTAGEQFACRFLTDVHILYIEGGTAYLELTPYQAHALWALQGAGVTLMGERYGVTSDPLAPMDPLQADKITLEELMAPAPALSGARVTPVATPAVPEAQAAPEAQPAQVLPGSTPAAIPGSGAPIPGTAPTAAPTVTAAPAPTDPSEPSESGSQP